MVETVTILISVVVLLSTLFGLVLFLLIRRLPYQYTQRQFDERIKASLARQLYTVKGSVGEAFAPHMREFIEKYEPADVRFLGGKPVDYIVYKGYNRVYNTDEPIDEVVFVEVKTSKEKKRRLDKNEAKIKDAIDTKRVRHDTITIHVED